MGSSMCDNLMRAGSSATVSNRTRARPRHLLAQGARWADSPRQVAAACDVIFSMVGFPSDVREVVLGGNGALAGYRAGAILVDMTTSEPTLAEEIAGRRAARGVFALDAPGLGRRRRHHKARLSIMIGGNARTVAALGPCWQALGKTIVHHGGPGTAGTPKW